jgi:hypothetical protein
MGAKLVSEEQPPERRIVYMADMNPLEWGRIIGESKYTGHLVMRTADRDNFEVIDMTKMHADGRWTCETGLCLKVELARNGEKFTFEIEGQ